MHADGVQDDDTPTVTFPDDYPNSVRHFLLIGFLGMFIGAIVFFYMGISRKVNTVMHVLTFFIAAVSACAYYAEWAGLGVEYKTTDTTPRVIFWAHYLDWVITGPVSFRSVSITKCMAGGVSKKGQRMVGNEMGRDGRPESDRDRRTAADDLCRGGGLAPREYSGVVVGGWKLDVGYKGWLAEDRKVFVEVR
jgi:hypothetical protein